MAGRNTRSTGGGGRDLNSSFVSGGQYNANQIAGYSTSSYSTPNQTGRYQSAGQNNTPSYQNNAKTTPQQQKLPQQQQKPLQPQQQQQIPMPIIAPKIEPKSDSEKNVESMEVDGAEKPTKDASWKKGPLNKLSNRERRGRQNKRLRKILTPKNALMVLNELQGSAVPEYKLALTSTLSFNMPNQNSQYTAEVAVNGTSYQGQGISKNLAKNHAAEQAIRDLVISRMNAERQKLAEGSEAGDSTGASSLDLASAGADDDSSVPMLHLASYALHKLFLEWQAEGFEVPLLTPKTQSLTKATGAGVLTEEKKTPVQKPRKELPPNAASVHPTMLLTQMRPGSVYEDLGVQGTTPGSMTFTVGVTVEGQQYVGSGRNKKEARKQAAQQACMKIFGLKYEVDYSMDVTLPQKIASVLN